NVEGIPFGEYEIGGYFNKNTWYWGNLCKELKSDNTCKTQVVGNIYPNLSQKQIISYSSGEWTVDDGGNLTGNPRSEKPPTIPSLAPGIMLFYGDVIILKGLFVNSILSTGDITIKDGDKALFAPNFAG